MRILFVIGGPGSGKGTQCDLIVKTYGLTHLSTGDLMRDEVASKSPRGTKLKEVMDKGDLVPLETVLELLKDAMKKVGSASSGFLIDGYPRELEQGKRFEQDVGPVESVIYFRVSDAVMQQRILERGKSSGRSDDNKETVVKRIANFNKNNQPIVDYYAKENKLITINAEASVQKVFAEVEKSLKKVLHAC